MADRDMTHRYPMMLSSDSLLIPLLTNNNDTPANIFSNIFTILFDNVAETDRMNEAIENSLNTYNDELFKRKENVYITIEAKNLQSDKLCFICLEQLTGKVYELGCGHIFHQGCLDRAISHQHYQCSICKSAIPIQQSKKEEYENENGHRIALYLKEN